MFNKLILILEKQKIQEYTLQNSSKILHQDNKNYRNQYSKCKSEFMVKLMFEKINLYNEHIIFSVFPINCK